MARLQKFTGDSIEVLLEEIREKFKGDAKIVSATRTKRRSAFGLSTKYRYELLIERISESQTMELPSTSGTDVLGDLSLHGERESQAPLPATQYASFAIELQNAYMSAKGMKAPVGVDSFVGSEAEDTLVLSAAAKKGLAKAPKSHATAGSRTAYRDNSRDNSLTGSVTNGLLATGSEDFAAQVASPKSEIASLYTPMVVNNEGKWRVPARISEPSWRSLDEEDEVITVSATTSDITRGRELLVQGPGGLTGAEVRFRYPKGDERKVATRMPSSAQPNGQDLLIDLTDDSNLIKFPTPHIGAARSSKNGDSLQSQNQQTQNQQDMIRDQLAEFVSELHDWPIINSGDVVIFVGSSEQAMSSFDKVCDIYGVDADRRFIIAGSGIPKWFGTALQRVTSAIAEGHRSTRSFAIWLSEQEVIPVVEKLGRRTSVIVAHLDDPKGDQSLGRSFLPRIDALSLSSINSADDLFEVFKYGIPVLALEGERSTDTLWMRMVDRYLKEVG
ncbi:MAG: hypothetical protein HKL83_09075 [Acidimicrobiaceae bacterium]|nr:hypothetical protein [Acidimicrobiaceae bacterium]